MLGASDPIRWLLVKYVLPPLVDLGNNLSALQKKLSQNPGFPRQEIAACRIIWKCSWLDHEKKINNNCKKVYLAFGLTLGSQLQRGLNHLVSYVTIIANALLCCSWCDRLNAADLSPTQNTHPPEFNETGIPDGSENCFVEFSPWFLFGLLPECIRSTWPEDPECVTLSWPGACLYD